MSAKTTIEWTATVHPDGTVTPGSTWNPIRGTAGRWGCSKISPGCDSCYASDMNRRFSRLPYPRVGEPPNDTLRLDDEHLFLPSAWRKPRRIFVCSMTDIAEERVPHEWVSDILTVMLDGPTHTFMVLTKRPRRLERFINQFMEDTGRAGEVLPPHIWVGTTVENQDYAWRVQVLQRIPAAVLWVSAEPLLGPLDLMEWLPNLDWVVAGGESGPNFRPCDPAWLRSLRNQCLATGTAYFVKQGGGRFPGRPTGDPELDACKEFPTAPAQEAVHA